jgi:hypothetical protein
VRPRKRFPSLLAVWKSAAFGKALEAVSLCFLLYWLFHTPPPNYSLIAMAVVAGVMPLRGDMDGRERTAWAVMLIMFALIEMRAIHKDNLDRDNRQAAAEMKLKNNFEGIGNEIKENIYSVTGGDNFVVFFPINIPNGGGVSLAAGVEGPDKTKHYTVRQVRYEMNEGQPPFYLSSKDVSDTLSGRAPAGRITGNLGDVPSDFSTPVLVLHPFQGRDSYYNINFFALNGSTNEKLHLRYDKKQGAWDREITVTRGNTVVFESAWSLEGNKPPS